MLHAVATLGLALAPGCAGPAAPAEEPAAPSAHAHEGQSPSLPVPDAAAVAEGLEAVIAALDAVDPAWLYGAYVDTVAAWGDGACPAPGDHNGQQLWSGDCTTAGGAQFLGYALSTEQTGFPHDDGRQVDRLLWLSGIQRVVLPDGAELGVVGDDLVLEVPAQDGAPRSWETRLVGEFWSSLPEHAGSWLEAGALVDLDLAYTRPDDGRALALSGSLSWLDGPIVAATFEEVGLAERDAYCGLEPTGRVRLRDAGGTWVELVHDGANADGYRAVGCDGCGRAVVDGPEGELDLGEVCADWARLLAWEYTPW